MTLATWLFNTISLLQEASNQNSPAKPVATVELVFRVVSFVGSTLAALGAIIAFFLTRYWVTRDRKLAAENADKAKLRDVLYQSLRWFEGGTQNRSIGIAVVQTSWETHPEFQKLWIEVLANQVIYLLAAQEPKDRPHEYENLRRMLDILAQQKSLLDSHTKGILCDTIVRKAGGDIKEGLPLTDKLKESLGRHKKELGCSK